MNGIGGSFLLAPLAALSAVQGTAREDERELKGCRQS